MRRPSPLVDRGNAADVDSAMTPMIDVVFLLLVFFVWTASFQIVEQILPSEVSEQQGTGDVADIEPVPQDDFDDVVVKVDWDGVAAVYQINGQPVPGLPEVQQQLTAIAGIRDDAPVILHPQPTVPVGVVIGAWDVAKLSGFEKISFAVNAGK